MILRSRGVTLLETLIASAVFVIILVAVIQIERVGRDAASKNDAQTETFRMAALADEHVRRELRASRVLAFSGKQGSLRYTPAARTAEGFVEVDGSGIVFQTEPAEILMDGDGNLVRDFGVEPARILAALGTEGSAEFELVEEDLLRATYVAVRQDVTGQSRYQLTVDYYLRNQP
ncbi:MAG: hypothetical protein HY319_11320 [Armatimonadetes bacterium]|nr:hypothetical protein [Armatimonadota bacterium]